MDFKTLCNIQIPLNSIFHELSEVPVHCFGSYVFFSEYVTKTLFTASVRVFHGRFPRILNATSLQLSIRSSHFLRLCHFGWNSQAEHDGPSKSARSFWFGSSPEVRFLAVQNLGKLVSGCFSALYLSHPPQSHRPGFSVSEQCPCDSQEGGLRSPGAPSTSRGAVLRHLGLCLPRPAASGGSLWPPHLAQPAGRTGTPGPERRGAKSARRFLRLGGRPAGPPRSLLAAALPAPRSVSKRPAYSRRPGLRAVGNFLTRRRSSAAACGSSPGPSPRLGRPPGARAQCSGGRAARDRLSARAGSRGSDPLAPRRTPPPRGAAPPPGGRGSARGSRWDAGPAGRRRRGACGLGRPGGRRASSSSSLSPPPPPGSAGRGPRPGRGGGRGGRAGAGRSRRSRAPPVVRAHSGSRRRVRAGPGRPAPAEKQRRQRRRRRLALGPPRPVWAPCMETRPGARR